MKYLLILLFLISTTLFAHPLEDQIAKEKELATFANLHYELNNYFETKIDQSEAVELRIFTYNAGMLSLPLVAVPQYKERIQYLIEMLDGVDFDILALQEIWNKDDREMVTQFALDNDYRVYSGTKRNGKKHGLYLLINKFILDSDVNFSEFIYKKQAWYEPLTGYKKGFLRADFRLRNGKNMTVTNTHLTAVAKNIRDKQAQEFIKEVKVTSDYFVFAGDLNNTLFMEEQVYWPLVRHYQFMDVHFAKYPNDPGYTYDPETNSIAKFWHVEKSGQERIDYLLLGRKGEDSGYYVRESGLLFTEDLPFDGCNIEGLACKLSDHYGVGAWTYLY